MQVEHGGFEPCVSQVTLYEEGADPGFKQMGGVSMSQGMDGHIEFGDPGALFGFTEGPLDTAAVHGLSGGSPMFVIAPGGRKEPSGMAMGLPVGTQEGQSVFRQGHVAVLGALATVDMDHQALTVDVGDLQGEAFMESESAAVDGGKVDLVVQGGGGLEKPTDFFHTEDGWQAVFSLRPRSDRVCQSQWRTC